MIARRGILSEDTIVCIGCAALAGLGLAGLHYGWPPAAAIFWGVGGLLAAWAWWPRAGTRMRRLRRALRRELASRGYVESADAAYKSEPLYDSALFMNSRFPFNELVPAGVVPDRHMTEDLNARKNTVCLQSKQYVVSDMGAGGMRTVPPEDHLGDVQVGSAGDWRSGLSTTVRSNAVELYSPK